MQTASHIIKALGGATEVARETGFPMTTVHSWTRSNFIPAWRREHLLELAKRKNVELRPEQFPAKPSHERAA